MPTASVSWRNSSPPPLPRSDTLSWTCSALPRTGPREAANAMCLVGPRTNGASAPLASLRHEFLDESAEVAVHDGLGVLDPGHLAVEGGPAHPLGLVGIIADAAFGSRA